MTSPQARSFRDRAERARSMRSGGAGIFPVPLSGATSVPTAHFRSSSGIFLSRSFETTIGNTFDLTSEWARRMVAERPTNPVSRGLKCLLEGRGRSLQVRM